ncbi:hypothetical protein NAEGRDRAFT_57283 [Naegleria gruberi]|uniref:Uncharacterized protein n=2 Tax=Naegleria gruberi TaxID=5762 RepID=D2V6F3_NAEGR|nr:uncharacterized protein NAEGRDRAFT_57283 [Naegleria gruberi]EFC47562.1 hypothetical protein NAEGRDRAFT_57283 [Naegleria gruberi]|eukprot:XP_002680306.1 hypothetical protein NAEGRDRAFT_57283 [Naegleria gruberi strain NEG-M]
MKKTSSYSSGYFAPSSTPNNAAVEFLLRTAVSEEEVVLFEPLSSLKRKQSRQIILPPIPSSPTRKRMDVDDTLLLTPSDLMEEDSFSMISENNNSTFNGAEEHLYVDLAMGPNPSQTPQNIRKYKGVSSVVLSDSTSIPSSEAKVRISSSYSSQHHSSSPPSSLSPPSHHERHSPTSDNNSTLGYLTANKKRVGIDSMELSPIPNMKKHSMDDEDMVLQQASPPTSPMFSSLGRKALSANAASTAPTFTATAFMDANKKMEETKKVPPRLSIVKPSSRAIRKAPSSPVRAYIYSKSVSVDKPKSEKSPKKKESPPKKQKKSFEMAPSIYLNPVVKLPPSPPKKALSMPRLSTGTTKRRPKLSVDMCVNNNQEVSTPNSARSRSHSGATNLVRMGSSTIQLLSNLPFKIQEVVIEFYGGSFSKTCCFDGILNYSKFIKTYFGKFKEANKPRFIFKYLHVESTNLSFQEISHLIQIQSLHRHQMSIVYPISHYLFSFPKRTIQLADENEIENNLVEKLELFTTDNSLCTKITELNIEGIETFESLITLAVRKFNNLEKICFGRSVLRTKMTNSRSYYLDENFAKVFAETNYALKHLEYCGPTTFITSEFVTHTPNLEIIRIESRNFISDVGDCVANWKNLQVLDCKFDRNHFGHEKKANAYIFFTALNTIQTLHTLKLEGYAISGEEFLGLKNNHTIQVLNLSRATMSEDVFNTISTFSNLKHLYADSIIGNSLNSLGKLANLSKLEILDLKQNTAFGDAGCAMIGNVKSLRKLYVMNLGEDQIHDKGVTELSSLTNLEELDVRFCDITNKGLVTIAKACSKLQTIHVGGCSKVDVNSLPLELRLKTRK